MDSVSKERHLAAELSSTFCNRFQARRLADKNDSKSLPSRLASSADKFLTYALVICIGVIVGWILGWYVGGSYVERRQPVYFSVYSSVDEISAWQAKPLEFAASGRVPGAIAAIAALAAAHSRSRRHRSER